MVNRIGDTRGEKLSVIWLQPPSRHSGLFQQAHTGPQRGFQDVHHQLMVTRTHGFDLHDLQCVQVDCLAPATQDFGNFRHVSRVAHARRSHLGETVTGDTKARDQRKQGPELSNGYKWQVLGPAKFGFQNSCLSKPYRIRR